MDQQPTPSKSGDQVAAQKEEANVPPTMRFAAPFEVLGPCRSRILVGTAMFAVLVGLIFLLAG